MSHLTSSIAATSVDASATNAESGPQAVVPVRVWDLPTRIVHWSLAASFAGAWLSAESERWRDIHVVLGYTLAGLIAFRLIWGVVGSRYARFSNFAFPPSRLVAYLKSLLKGAPEHHAGHNPAGGLAIFGLLALGITVAASGYATYQELGGEWLEDLHEGAANAMLGLVFIHLAGVVVSSVLHKENLVRSMITGWKQGRPDEGIARAYPLLGVLLLVTVLGFWGYSQSTAGRDFLNGSPGVGQPGVGSTPTLDRERDGKSGRHDEGKRKEKRKDEHRNGDRD